MNTEDTAPAEKPDSTEENVVDELARMNRDLAAAAAEDAGDEPVESEGDVGQASESEPGSGGRYHRAGLCDDDPDVDVSEEDDDGDFSAYYRPGGEPIYMEVVGGLIEFTSPGPITPARLREFISHKEVWLALGRHAGE